MIAFSVIKENQDGFFYKQELTLISIPKAYLQDDLDFNNNTFSDFLEYLDIQGVTDYLFISDGVRIKEVVSYLNDMSAISFHLMSEDGEVVVGNRELISQFYSVFRSSLLEKSLKYEHIERDYLGRKRRSIIQFMTGIYPGNLKKHAIKHAYLESEEVLEKLNSKLFLDFFINSVIYIEDCTRKKSNLVLPVMKFDFNQIKETEIYQELVQFSAEEVHSLYEKFSEENTINQEVNAVGVVDISSIFGLDTNNRLFFRSNGIYVDYKCTKKISSNLALEFLQIKNKISCLASYPNIDKEDIIYFHLCYTLKKFFPNSKVKFLIFKDNDMEEKYLGIHSRGKHFIYSIHSNTVREIPQKLFMLLKELRKGKLSKISRQKIEKIIRQVL